LQIISALMASVHTWAQTLSSVLFNYIYPLHQIPRSLFSSALCAVSYSCRKNAECSA
jgi:hypothetical protein